MKRLIICFLFAVLVFIPVSFAEEVVLENSHVSISFDVEADNIKLDSIKKLNSGYTFSFEDYPLWWLLLRDVNSKDIIFVHSKNVHCDNSTSALTNGQDESVLLLKWQNCEAQPENFVDITYTITLGKNDKLSRWRATIDNKMNDFGVYMLKIPFQIKQDTTQDTFVVYPAETGRLVKNPADTINKLVTIRVSGVSLQLAPYYTENGDGLYLASADGSATYNKQQEFESDGASYTYQFGYYPEDDITAGNDFSAPYDYYVGVFDGDWYDAAKIYRSWAEKTKILEKGKLKYRSDVPNWYKNLDLITISFLNDFSNYNKVADDYGAANDFYGADNSVLLIWNWYENQNSKGYGEYKPLSTISPFIAALKNNNIHASVYTLSFALSSTNDYSSSLAPYVAKDNVGNVIYSDKINKVYFMDVSSDAWQEHYQEIAKFNIVGVAGADSIYFDNPYPTYYGDYDINHGHPLGEGGNYIYEGYVNLLDSVRKSARQSNPNFITFYEKESERYIRVSDSIGISSLLTNTPIGDASNALPIPLFPTIYHDYAVQIGANNKPHYLIEGYTNYDDLNYALASGAIYGAVPFVSESAYELGFPLNFQLEDLPESGAYGKSITQHARFVRDIIAMRKVVQEYVVFGELLRDPETNADIAVKKFCANGGNPNMPCALGNVYNIHTKEILSSAWKTVGGDIGLFFINYNNNDRKISFTINTEQYGLSSSKNYGLYVVTSNGNISLVEEFKGDRTIAYTFPGLKPIFFKILPASSVKFCGDNLCSNTETCDSCSLDCGDCPEEDTIDDPTEDQTADNSESSNDKKPDEISDDAEIFETSVNEETKEENIKEDNCGKYCRIVKKSPKIGLSFVLIGLIGTVILIIILLRKNKDYTYQGP